MFPLSSHLLPHHHPSPHSCHPPRLLFSSPHASTIKPFSSFIRHSETRSPYLPPTQHNTEQLFILSLTLSLFLLLVASASQYVQQYLHRGQILRTKNDYRSGQDRLELWLESAEVTLNTTNVCTVEAVKEYAEELKVKLSWRDGVEGGGGAGGMVGGKGR